MANITLTDVINYEDFTFALCTFVDEFKRNPNRQKMIESPPSSSSAELLNLCILAGTAHKLANEFGITVPGWVHEATYRMPEPYFAYNTQNKEYQAFLLEDTAHEFASKNLFVGSNAIERV